jgi:hypothetical protein
VVAEVIWTANEPARGLLSQRPDERSLPPAIARIVASGFAESNGCLYIRALQNQEVDLEHVGDRTGLEALVNHFHVEGDGETAADFWTALNAAESLAEALDQGADVGPARVIVSRDGGEHPNSTVRIVRRRPNEPWLSEDLEAYSEPVGYIDVN